MALRPAAECQALADAVLARVPAGQAEVVVVESDTALTRFAANGIHQNVAETGTTLRLRILHQGRVGAAELRGGDAAPARLVAAAEAARRLAPEQSRSVPLPSPDGGADRPTGWSEATAATTPEQRCEVVAEVVRAAAGAGMEAFGTCATAAWQRAVVSTVGVRRHARSTEAALTAVVRGADGSGYADRFASGLAGIDAQGLAAEVVDTAGRNQGAVGADAGTYEVVLAPYAVAEMIEYLSLMGFSALARQEGRSFMRPGERLFSPAVTIRDDATDPAGLPFPFDWEGVSTRPVTLVEAGVCRDLVHDSATALTDGVSSTGHALPMPNTVGPWAANLALAAGGADLDGLIGSVRRGIYVTRFWYVREVHPLRTVITGMTREGTFAIEDGRLGRPVRDLRFTQSIVEALSGVLGISAERRLERLDEMVTVLAPWLHLRAFSFTS